MDDRVIPDVMNNFFFYPKEDILNILEVGQEGGVKKGGTWRRLRVPDRRHGGHGYS